jgi:hypothetical protein
MSLLSFGVRRFAVSIVQASPAHSPCWPQLALGVLVTEAKPPSVLVAEAST